jgi:hypothetical protein
MLLRSGAATPSATLTPPFALRSPHFISISDLRAAWEWDAEELATAAADKVAAAAQRKQDEEEAAKKKAKAGESTDASQCRH